MNDSAFDYLPFLKARGEKRLPNYSYKLTNEPSPQLGYDVLLPDQLDIDEGEMSLVIPFADGNRRDGVGDLLEVGGIDCSRHLKNPVALWNHGKEVVLPIGLAERPAIKEYTVRIDPILKRAEARVWFYTGKGITGTPREEEREHALFCEQLFDLAAKRFIRAGSIGYSVQQARQLDPDYQTGTPAGLHLLKTLLLEVSLVVMPANMDTVRHNGKGWDGAAEILALPRVCGKALSPYLIKSLTPLASAPKAMLLTGEKAKTKPGAQPGRCECGARLERGETECASCRFARGEPNAVEQARAENRADRETAKKEISPLSDTSDVPPAKWKPGLGADCKALPPRSGLITGKVNGRHVIDPKATREEIEGLRDWAEEEAAKHEQGNTRARYLGVAAAARTRLGAMGTKSQFTGDRDWLREEQAEAEHKQMKALRAKYKKQPSDDITPEKARQMLKDGTAQGHPLTEKQRGMLGAAAGRDQKAMPDPFKGNQDKQAQDEKMQLREARSRIDNLFRDKYSGEGDSTDEYNRFWEFSTPAEAKDALSKVKPLISGMTRASVSVDGRDLILTIDRSYYEYRGKSLPSPKWVCPKCGKETPANPDNFAVKAGKPIKMMCWGCGKNQMHELKSLSKGLVRGSGLGGDYRTEEERPGRWVVRNARDQRIEVHGRDWWASEEDAERAAAQHDEGGKALQPYARSEVGYQRDPQVGDVVVARSYIQKYTHSPRDAATGVAPPPKMELFARSGDRMKVVELLGNSRLRVRKSGGEEAEVWASDLRFGKDLPMQDTKDWISYSIEDNSMWSRGGVHNQRSAIQALTAAGLSARTGHASNTVDVLVRSFEDERRVGHVLWGKSLPALRKKYRTNAKNFRRRLRKSAMGSSLVYCGNKELAQLRAAAEGKGLLMEHLGPCHKCGKGIERIKLSGDDKAIDAVAMEWGRPVKSWGGARHKSLDVHGKAVNHMGEQEYRSFAAWRRAVLAKDPSAKIEGDKEVANAPGVGEWDGEVGVVYNNAGKSLKSISQEPPRSQKPPQSSKQPKSEEPPESEPPDMPEGPDGKQEKKAMSPRADLPRLKSDYLKWVEERGHLTPMASSVLRAWVNETQGGDRSIFQALAEELGFNKSLKGKSMATKTKQLPPTAPPEEAPVPMDAEAPGDEAVTEELEADQPQEPYGAQVLRRIHEDHSLLMQHYDEMLELLDHSEVKKHITSRLEECERVLTDTEEMFAKEYAHLPAIEGAMDEGEEVASGEEGEKGEDLAEEGDTDAVAADSGPEDSPSGDEVVEGMQKKHLRARRKGVCPECGKDPCTCGKSLKGKAKDFPEIEHADDFEEVQEGPSTKALEDHEEAAAREAHGFLKELSTTGDFHDEHRMKSFHYHKALDSAADGLALRKGLDEAEQMDKVDSFEEVQEGGKALEEPKGEETYVEDLEKGDKFLDEYKAIHEVKSVSHELGLDSVRIETDRKMLTRRRGSKLLKLAKDDEEMEEEEKAMDDMAAPGEIPDDSQVNPIMNEVGEDLSTAKMLHKALKGASGYLKSLSATRDFGEPHRQEAALHHSELGKALDAAEQMDKVDDVEEVQERAEPGAIGEKALAKDSNGKEIQEGDRVKINANYGGGSGVVTEISPQGGGCLVRKGGGEEAHYHPSDLTVTGKALERRKSDEDMEEEDKALHRLIARNQKAVAEMSRKAKELRGHLARIN